LENCHEYDQPSAARFFAQTSPQAGGKGKRFHQPADHLALTEKMSALLTEEYLEERAKRGSRKRFQRAMAKVPKVTPEEYDRLAQR
jgi:hypothetical protein